MKVHYLLICIFFTVACSPSKTDENGREAFEKVYPSLVTLNPPENQKTAPSAIYVNSVKIINYKNKKVLLIKGHFANGCTSLKDVTSKVEGDTLSLSVKGWQPIDKMCTQALVPFVFIHDKLPGGELQQYSAIKVNETPYKLE